MIFAKFFDEVTDLYDLFWIKSDRRFVQNDDLRICLLYTSDFYTPLDNFMNGTLDVAGIV